MHFILRWTRRSLVSKGSLLPPIQQPVLKNITPLDPKNSKNSKWTLVTGINVLALLKAYVFVFFQQTLNLLFELDHKGTYYVICPTCCKQCIPCLMCFNVIYSFICKCVVCWSYALFNWTSWFQNFVQNCDWIWENVHSSCIQFFKFSDS